MNASNARDKPGKPPRYWAVVPAAGLGKRMGAGVAKQYLRIGQRTILELTLERLSRLPELAGIVLALHPDDHEWASLDSSRFHGLLTVTGGDERFHSVVNALRRLRGQAEARDWVLVHDAVRPCVTLSDIRRLMKTLEGDPVGGILAAPVKETVKLGNVEGTVESTLDRSRLWLAATPQMFRYGVLCDALELAAADQQPVTDEAGAVEALGLPVKLVAGRADNIKITHPEDLRLAEFLLRETEEQA